jgi:hypothetical protein
MDHPYRTLPRISRLRRSVRRPLPERRPGIVARAAVVLGVVVLGGAALFLAWPEASRSHDAACYEGCAAAGDRCRASCHEAFCRLTCSNAVGLCEADCAPLR